MCLCPLLPLRTKESSCVIPGRKKAKEKIQEVCVRDTFAPLRRPNSLNDPVTTQPAQG